MESKPKKELIKKERTKGGYNGAKGIKTMEQKVKDKKQHNQKERQGHSGKKKITPN